MMWERMAEFMAVGSVWEESLLIWYRVLSISRTMDSLAVEKSSRSMTPAR